MSIGNAYTPTDRVVDANGQSILGADGRPDVTQVVQVTRVKNGVRPGTAPNQVAYLDEVYWLRLCCRSALFPDSRTVGSRNSNLLTRRVGVSGLYKHHDPERGRWWRYHRPPQHQHAARHSRHYY